MCNREDVMDKFSNRKQRGYLKSAKLIEECLLTKEETAKAIYTDSDKIYPNAFMRLKKEQLTKAIPIIQKAERERITDLMFENQFDTIVYFHPGQGNRDWANRWVAGTLTGRDGDLVCVKPCRTTKESERWLSPSASDPLSAVEKAVALKGEDNG